jgi:hypothetical protein
VTRSYVPLLLVLSAIWGSSCMVNTGGRLLNDRRLSRLLR